MCPLEEGVSSSGKIIIPTTNKKNEKATETFASTVTLDMESIASWASRDNARHVQFFRKMTSFSGK